jgi:Histidine phosphatase superfamily (branch 1)
MKGPKSPPILDRGRACLTPRRFKRTVRFEEKGALIPHRQMEIALRAPSTLSETLPGVYLARHGETAWSLSGQHTGLTDLPLTERGERNARRLGKRLQEMTFAKAFTSPCSGRSGPASWLASAPSLKSIPTCSNGIMASTKVAARRRFTLSAQTGNCSATAARGAKRRIR